MISILRPRGTRDARLARVPVSNIEAGQDDEVTYTWNRGEQKEFWLLVIRIYFSGDAATAIPADMPLSLGVRAPDTHLRHMHGTLDTPGCTAISAYMVTRPAHSGSEP